MKLPKTFPETALSDLQQKSETLFLSTLDPEGIPSASCAPFIMDEQDNFYIFVSKLAVHTTNLLQNPHTTVMLAEDEQDSRQLFARKRATYKCLCGVVNKESAEYETLLDKFAERFGNVISLLRSFPDFTLFRLEVQSGSFVQGFGQSYEITEDGLLHVDPSKN